MSNEVLIQVENVSKKFCRRLRRSLWYGLKDMAAEATGGSPSHDDLRPDEFWAVKGVSFELRRGECLGLLGHNGAGKTTLLKMLNGLIKPDHGSITLRGRVGALIALGAGFNPILTGRENIYVNGQTLGLSRREVDGYLDEIIDFSELGDFVDTPVQNYSSGMHVRLGFSIASTIRPEILLLDEVLAVGDVGFAIKCINRIRELSRRAAVIFVSHNTQMVSLFCNRILLMEHGSVSLATNDVGEGAARYVSSITAGQAVSGNGRAQVRSIRVRVDGGRFLEAGDLMRPGSSLELELEVAAAGVVGDYEMMVSIDDEAMTQIYCFPVEDDRGQVVRFRGGVVTVRLDLGRIELNTGRYSFLVHVRESDTQEFALRHQGLLPFVVRAERVQWGKVVRRVQPQTDSGRLV
jgi:lipopolysaccharide transport system ATP-binding protein